MTLLLETKKLSVHYTSDDRITKAISNVDIVVNEGERIGIVGESGSGKSTLALSILRLIDAPGRIYGEIGWMGKNIMNMGEAEVRKIRGKEISMVFQDPFTALNPLYKVGDQIAEIYRYHKGLSRRESWKKAVEMLDMVHISDPDIRARDYPHQFSGGMKQRVSIAMAYALSPKLMIADEPTTALDVTSQNAIIELLKELKSTMLFISHNVALVSQLCSRIYVIQDGKIVEEGTTGEVIRNPKNIYTAKLISSFKEISCGFDRS